MSIFILAEPARTNRIFTTLIVIKLSMICCLFFKLAMPELWGPLIKECGNGQAKLVFASGKEKGKQLTLTLYQEEGKK